MLEFTQTNIEETKDEEYHLGQMEDPEIQRMIFEKIQLDNRFKKKTNFKMNQDDFPSLVSDKT